MISPNVVAAHDFREYQQQLRTNESFCEDVKRFGFVTIQMLFSYESSASCVNVFGRETSRLNKMLGLHKINKSNKLNTMTTDLKEHALNVEKCITEILKISKNTKPSNELISEMCTKYNVSEKTIRRIGEFTKSK